MPWLQTRIAHGPCQKLLRAPRAGGQVNINICMCTNSYGDSDRTYINIMTQTNYMPFKCNTNKKIHFLAATAAACSLEWTARFSRFAGMNTA